MRRIPLFARIITLVDSYDVMTNDRIYKKAISKEEAIEEIKRCSGTQCDPRIVEAFLECNQINKKSRSEAKGCPDFKDIFFYGL